MKRQWDVYHNKTIPISFKTAFSLQVTSSYSINPPKDSPNTTLTPQSQSAWSFRPKYPTNCNNYQFDLLINIYILYPLPNIINRGPQPHDSQERNVSTSCWDEFPNLTTYTSTKPYSWIMPNSKINFSSPIC